MAMSNTAGLTKRSSLVLALCYLFSVASAGPASIYPMKGLQSWAQGQLMTLEVQLPDAGHTTWNVLPLTSGIGANQSQTSRGMISIQGNLVETDATNYLNLTSHDAVASLCCDNMNDSNIDPNRIMNRVMEARPRAILLYSIREECCGLGGSDLAYSTIFTITSKETAQKILNLTSTSAGNIMATITGNSTNETQDDPGGQTSNSAVAMSILYSITGLITLLFLVIIATGAIRAHRYPERYGPRSGYGGRPRQSRAKGLARAVLETLPIVKFGDPRPAKADPGAELESQQSRASQDLANGTRVSGIPEEHVGNRSESLVLPTVSRAAAGQATHNSPIQNQQDGAVEGTQPTAGGAGGDEALGCSICTEDFTVGEDVRVLPCDHKFHPPCIDPWLTNVSGTCPLCRLDLRPPAEQLSPTSEAALELPPPLDVDGGEQQDPSSVLLQSNRRASRLLDLQILRDASTSVEERLGILRRHRSQQGGAGSERESEEQRRRSMRLANRLREKFKIRTRTQDQGPTASGASGD